MTTGRINRQSIAWCALNLGKQETATILRMAFKTESFRRKWIRTWGQILDRINEMVADQIISTGEVYNTDTIQAHIEFFLQEHSEASARKGLDDAYNPKNVRLSSKGLAYWQKYWDRVKKSTLKRNEALAKKVKKQYLDRCKSVFEQVSQDFRSGKVYDKKEIVKVLTNASDGAKARGKMIVETETTRYYNQARKSYYDRSDDVTHYLFLAILDTATTEWCKTRHKLVYTKGEAVTTQETPPVHWNCRSEMTPLTPLNPRHKAIIDNARNLRDNRNPAPLPKGWNK